MDTDSRICPYCAEPINPLAVVCPHCRSRLDNAEPAEIYRERAGRRLAGVAIALADFFGISVTAVRVAFVLLTFFHLIGVIVYGVLWLLLPEKKGGTSIVGGFLSALAGDPHSAGWQRLRDRIRSLIANIGRAARVKVEVDRDEAQASAEADLHARAGGF